MTLEQNPCFLPNCTGNLCLDAVASPDQYLGVFRQDDRQNIPAILGNDRVAWSDAVIVVANQFSLDERCSGLSFVRSDNRNIDERGSIDMFEQKVSGTTRKACGNGMVFDHLIIPTFHTRKYPPCWCGCPVANGEFVPYNRSMGKPNIAKRTVRALERRLAEMQLPPETAALGQRLLLVNGCSWSTAALGAQDGTGAGAHIRDVSVAAAGVGKGRREFRSRINATTLIASHRRVNDWKQEQRNGLETETVKMGLAQLPDGRGKGTFAPGR